jgi:transglutaminase-like putative cysteine protease
MKLGLSGCLVCILALMSLLLPARMPGKFPAASRSFGFTYQLTLKEIPSGTQRVRIWIPRADSDVHQAVVLKKVDGPVRLRDEVVAPFANHLLYGEIRRPQSPTAEFIAKYEVTRTEYSKGDYEELQKVSEVDRTPPRELRRYLAPDRLVPIDGRIKRIADEATRGKVTTVDKARALYDFVFHTVSYDKSGTGWGRGDSLWVCDAKHGNCTDFHSLFISLARAEGIPARFEIGFPVPSGSGGTIRGYHCWAEFYVRGAGWVPVDISEAWKDPRKHDYFFGSLDANRVQFSVGRDLVLQPHQQGEPLNYFIYPYVELDGKPFDKIETRFSYRQSRGGLARVF